MADYQVRKWRAWHRHMAMVALAGLFVMEERLSAAETEPLLSVRDIVKILDWYFRKSPSLEKVVEQVVKRHERQGQTAAKRNPKPPPQARENSELTLTIWNQVDRVGRTGLQSPATLKCRIASALDQVA